jgi:hypothetical protein
MLSEESVEAPAVAAWLDPDLLSAFGSYFAAFVSRANGELSDALNHYRHAWNQIENKKSSHECCRRLAMEIGGDFATALITQCNFVFAAAILEQLVALTVPASSEAGYLHVLVALYCIATRREEQAQQHLIAAASCLEATDVQGREITALLLPCAGLSRVEIPLLAAAASLAACPALQESF